MPARKVYADPVKPLKIANTGRSAYDLLDLADVTGKRIVNTQLRKNITIREENSVAALEVMSRFAVDPRWLVYLPPTMSPVETTTKEGYLEHPDEAFKYFNSQGVEEIICEEKHMGSRAIVVACKDTKTAAKRFHVTDGWRVFVTREQGVHSSMTPNWKSSLSRVCGRLSNRLICGKSWIQTG